MDQDTSSKVKNFFSSYPVKRSRKGQVLVQAGDEPPGVFYLLSGSVQEYDIAANGEPVVVNVFKPPAFFPMSWAINKTPNQYFFEVASDIEYCLAPADDVVEFLHANHDVTFNLLARVFSGSDGLLRRMAHLMGGTARTRVLFELMVQARRFGAQQEDGSCLVPLNEHEFAKRAGLSRETVSRELRNLKDIVTIDRKGMSIQDLKLLEDELGGGI